MAASYPALLSLFLGQDRSMDGIDTRLVYGFLDAGKTTYINETVRDDLFYKRGKTLIISFEEGEEEYDEAALAEKRTSVAYFAAGAAEAEGSGKESTDTAAGGSEEEAGKSEAGAGNEIARFCSECIEKYQPDRIYVEMNAMTPGLRESLPGCMRVTFAVTLIDWSTMPVYYANFMQMMKQMVSESDQVVFRGCPSSGMLQPYSQAFRLMNPKAAYLRQDPMGYHERAFDRFLPYSLTDQVITIDEGRYLPFWLDALDHPEHYEGKRIRITDPVEVRKTDDGALAVGRVVMTCCMADLQFMSFRMVDRGAGGRTEDGIGSSGLTEGACGTGGPDRPDIADGRWVTVEAAARTAGGAYGQRIVELIADTVQPVKQPEELILDGRCQKMDLSGTWE